MRDGQIEPLPRRPALILKPLPDSEVPTNAAYRIGGMPNLPEEMEWPHHEGRPLHFFAQIDLSLMPRRGPSGAALPDMPTQGVLFIFIFLEHWAGEVPPAILYAEHPVDDVPPRRPPENLAHLLDDERGLAGMLHHGGVSDDGQLLRRQAVEPLPFTSYPVGWPIDSDLEHPQATEIEALLGRLPPLPDPHLPPPGVEAPWLAELPEWFQRDTNLAKATLDWDTLFDWAKEAYMRMLDLIREQLLREGPQHIPPYDRPGVGDVDALWDKVNWTHHKYHFWLFYFQVFINPDDEYPFDFRLKHFMEISQRCRGKVPARVRRDFFALLADIVKAALQGEWLHLEPVPLPEHGKIAAKDLAQTVLKAMDVLKPQRTGPPPQRPIPSDWDEYVRQTTTLPEWADAGFGVAGTGVIPLQMFGYGHLFQDAAEKNADKVLLLQIGSQFGTPLNFYGYGRLYQIWITPEDLAQGRFDGAMATCECD